MIVKKDNILILSVVVSLILTLVTFSLFTITVDIFEDCVSLRQDVASKELQITIYKEQLANYEKDLLYLDDCLNLLQDRLNDTYNVIETKDSLLLSYGHQPYGMLPCHLCESDVVIGIGEEDFYYIGCTNPDCTVFFGPYASIKSAAIEWNFREY